MQIKEVFDLLGHTEKQIKNLKENPKLSKTTNEVKHIKSLNIKEEIYEKKEINTSPNSWS